MLPVNLIQFVLDDEEIITVSIKDSLADIDEEGVVTLQVPVFADGRNGHIYLTSQECSAIERSPVIKEATRWALSSRMRNSNQKK
jgi:phosphoglycerate-specific signal transduction histidine kinase